MDVCCEGVAAAGLGGAATSPSSVTSLAGEAKMGHKVDT